jgi:2-methylisocitrate lyase-like PEP mutase family enzyme
MSRFRTLLASETPLVLPGAHDALSARLIQQAGFKAFVIGGFPLIGSRYGLPDLGLAGFGEIHAGVRDIVSACDLPVLVDADNGYGDEKTAVRTLNAYEKLGVEAVFFEDQTLPKRCGHLAGKDVVPAERMVRLLRTVTAERANNDTFIMARTDAIAVEGVDAAIRRAGLYLDAGADGVFVEGPRSVEELETVGRTIDAPQAVNVLHGGLTPRFSPAACAEMGFEIAFYGIDLVMHAAKAMRSALTTLAAGDLPDDQNGLTFAEYLEVVDLEKWAKLEESR